MSTFFAEIVKCPYCGEAAERSVAHSINATRSPQYRDAILRGEFQNYTCSKCGQDYLVDRPFIYLDYKTKDWIGVLPLNEEKEWQQWEQAPINAYKFACGANAPVVAQSIGEGMKIRTVFGLIALREKLLCLQARLDDVLLELLKFHLMLRSERFVLTEVARPRLIETDNSTLMFMTPIVAEGSELKYEIVSIDRQAYEEVVNNQEPWLAFIKELSNNSYVDLGRLIF
jgi:hypothetical protein